MAWGQKREGTGINHAQFLYAIHSGLAINNSTFIILGPHLAGACRVPQRHDIVLNVLEDLLVSLHLRTGIVLVSDDGRSHGIALECLTETLEDGNHGLLVGLGGQPVGVDDGVV